MSLNTSLEEEAVGIALILHPKDGEKITKNEHDKAQPNHRRHCGWVEQDVRGKI